MPIQEAKQLIMRLGPDTLIITNAGVKNVSELYATYQDEGKLPEALTYDTHFKVLKFTPIIKVERYDDIELYTAKFYDTFMSKMTAIACSRDTQIFRYDIIPTKNNPIIGGSYNVYGYLKANWKKADPDWQPISELRNHGSLAPNLASGDLVVKFVERKVLVEDFGYSLFTGKKEIKTRKKDSEPDLENRYEEMQVFASQSLQFNYNFIYVK